MGVVFFVFKKYLKDEIFARIAEKETLHENLLSEQTALENEQQRLTLLIKQEKMQIEDFHHKINEWKNKVILQQQIRQRESNMFLTTIKERNRAIALIQENTQVQNKVVDIVTTDLKNHFSHYFKDEQKRSAYMAHIIDFMNQRIS